MPYLAQRAEEVFQHTVINRIAEDMLHTSMHVRMRPVGTTVMVVRAGAENIGLPVNHCHGASGIMLKPLEGVLAGLTDFAGTALMGDGNVLMSLNPKGLLTIRHLKKYAALEGNVSVKDAEALGPKGCKSERHQ